MNIIIGNEEVFYQLLVKNSIKKEGIAKISMCFDTETFGQEFFIITIGKLSIALDKNDFLKAIEKLESHPIYIDYIKNIGEKNEK
ncbi:MAG: hypothetical protein ABIM21_00435 [candidate division WOR-3 bacterium]